jgi:hypothetical protein
MVSSRTSQRKHHRLYQAVYEVFTRSRFGRHLTEDHGPLLQNSDLEMDDDEEIKRELWRRWEAHARDRARDTDPYQQIGAKMASPAELLSCFVDRDLRAEHSAMSEFAATELIASLQRNTMLLYNSKSLYRNDRDGTAL